MQTLCPALKATQLADDNHMHHCSSLSTSQKCISVDFPNPREWSCSTPRKQRLSLIHLYADFILLSLLFSHTQPNEPPSPPGFPCSTGPSTIPVLYKPDSPVHLKAQSWLCFGTGQCCAPGKESGGGVIGKYPQSNNAVILTLFVFKKMPLKSFLWAGFFLSPLKVTTCLMLPTHPRALRDQDKPSLARSSMLPALSKT